MQTDALKRLIEAVEADAFSRLEASARYNYFCDMWEAALGVATVSYEKGWAAYRKGDLNAAKALHDALLPGWRITSLGQVVNFHDGSTAPEWWVRLDDSTSLRQVEVTSTDEARARLLAILRAKLAEANNITTRDETSV